MSADYRERVLAISEQLRAQGVSSYTSAPPIYRLVWRLGLRIRPPLYQSFATLAVSMGISFAVLWGLLMWFLFWRAEPVNLTGGLFGSLVAGVVFGLAMAAFYRWKASRLRLPPLEP